MTQDASTSRNPDTPERLNAVTYLSQSYAEDAQSATENFYLSEIFAKKYRWRGFG